MSLPENAHAKLLCPLMTEYVAKQLNDRAFCATSQCAMWRWTDTAEQWSGYVSEAKGEVLKADGWTLVGNSGYTKPYPPGQRPGSCGYIKNEYNGQ